MADRVTNEAVLVALRGHGIVINGPISMTGAQNSEWKAKIYQAALPYLQSLGPYPKDYFEDLFSKSITTAKKIQDIPVDATPEERLSQTLGAYGVSGQKLHEIMDEAIRIRKTTPGWYEGGKQFGVNEYAQAAVNILGNNGAVLDSLSNAGIKTPLTPAPNSPGYKATPPAVGPAQIPAEDPIGPKKGVEAAQQARAQEAKAAPATQSLGAPANQGQKPPGGGGPAGGGLPGMPDTRPIWQREGREPTPAEVDDFVHDNFGADAWFMDVPEVKAALTQMAREGITDPEEARRKVSSTQWYKNTASSARLWHAKERSDPASAMSDITEQTDFLQAQADQLGVTVDPVRMRYIAESSLRFGWSPSQINRAIAAEFRYDPKSKIQATKVVEMKDKAKKFMVPLSDEAIQTWATGLMSGQFNEASYDQYLKDSAKSLFPQLVAAIDSGMNVQDYVDPYRQIAAQTLEVNPDTIDFMDPKWRQAFDQKDDKGNRTIMTLSEWSSKIRTDKTYGYDKTQRGVQEASQFANSLLRKFGAIA